MYIIKFYHVLFYSDYTGEPYSEIWSVASQYYGSKSQQWKEWNNLFYTDGWINTEFNLAKKALLKNDPTMSMNWTVVKNEYEKVQRSWKESLNFIIIGGGGLFTLCCS